MKANLSPTLPEIELYTIKESGFHMVGVARVTSESWDLQIFQAFAVPK